MLSETHVLESNAGKYEKYFEGFDLKWNPAKKIARFGRAIGGGLYGVRKSLSSLGITYSFETMETFDIITLKDSHSCTFTLLPLYIRGESWHQEFDEFRDFVTNSTLVNPILLGDLNIRIGEHQQFMDTIFTETFSAGLNVRKSKDKIINNKGNTFMNFCEDYSVFVLNGTTRGDEDGEFTYINTMGQSVNDICAISLDMLPYVDRFEVDAQKWSDHMPIVLTLNVSVKSVAKAMKLLPKMKWKQDKKEEYQNKLNNNIVARKEIAEELNIKDLTEIIVASHTTEQHQNQDKVNSKWYNQECRRARDKSFKCLNTFRHTNSLEDKEIYLESNKYYRNLCKQKQKEYYDLLDLRINQVQESGQWWSIAKEIRGQHFGTGTGVSASDFRSYFQSLLNHPQEASDIQYARNLIHDDELDSPISVEEVKQILAKVKPEKAAGEDRIPYEFFVHASDLFLKELTEVFNRMFTEGTVDQCFEKSIIFPILKKGNPNEANNYRGISFMNCISKLLIGILNNRLTIWVERHNTLNEYQAGFRKGYSTMDNIYSLSALVNLKFSEKKKLYAFFIDFRAAFDKVPRKLLFYKLHRIGVSTKMLNFIESMYNRTEVAVWNGDEFSDYFETKSGVKQGCLISPLLFALYLNDLHDILNGGIRLNDLKIKVLMYADDIVMLADDPRTLQSMINRLEGYCDMWNMELNMNKSEIMIFRQGGRLASNEKWSFKGQTVRTVSEYCYLGVILTPRLKFGKHIEQRNKSAKNSINSVWIPFLNKKEISLDSKWKLFQAVTRAIQTYGAPIYGYAYFDEIDKLQRFFLKRIFRLPSFTPNYAIDLEFDLENGHIYTLNLHLAYIMKTLFAYGENRLPNKLSHIILQKNIFWARELNDLGNNYNIQWTTNDLTLDNWKKKTLDLTNRLRHHNKETATTYARSSLTRTYKDLDYTRGKYYIQFSDSLSKIMWIFKARSDLIYLNGTGFRNENRSAQCTLCNLRENETLRHFLAICPVLREYRIKYFNKIVLTDSEFLNVLNGTNNFDWNNLISYLISALNYRKFLINEFN